MVNFHIIRSKQKKARFLPQKRTMSDQILDTKLCEDLKRLFALGGSDLIAVIVCTAASTPEIKC